MISGLVMCPPFNTFAIVFYIRIQNLHTFYKTHMSIHYVVYVWDVLTSSIGNLLRGFVSVVHKAVIVNDGRIPIEEPNLLCHPSAC